MGAILFRSLVFTKLSSLKERSTSAFEYGITSIVNANLGTQASRSSPATGEWPLSLKTLLHGVFTSSCTALSSGGHVPMVRARRSDASSHRDLNTIVVGSFSSVESQSVAGEHLEVVNLSSELVEQTLAAVAVRVPRTGLRPAHGRTRR
ncbi:hypothetical protein HPB52_024871 [Rhipicephalus sanguineus]|uniref:Uncharacterized protein n=1 Tax=Rhipicephalus sanguineus TaxID=34632 RepID=A0A9D4TDS0_RHISA|nr:hypothetical protein HPB52_024871 [Rhipicephalus sanguineus]